MSATHCPECGAPLPSDAPRGLCPDCLLNAGLAPASDSPAPEHDTHLDAIIPAPPGAFSFKQETGAEQAPSVCVSEFRQTVVELGLMGVEEFDRAVLGCGSDVEGLVRSLSRAGLLTAYQAAAIRQGKARGLFVGDYLILDRLGQGGMGVVYKARHRQQGLAVALKMLPPSLARDRKLVLRFRREIHAAALVDHPNVVAVLDASEDRGVHFLTMEYIEGVDLDRFVRNGGVLAVAQAISFLIQAARGLAAAHARGIVHRDIKPANLMLDSNGSIRVLDLGLALIREGAAESAEPAAMTLTQIGSYMGTVDFMAPEQAHNSHTVDHRADIYSLACTLHFLLTIRPPFEGGTPLNRLIAHQHTPAPSLREKRPDVPEALDELYLAMMAKRPEDRPGSMMEVLARLEACLLSLQAIPPASPVVMTLPGPGRNGDSSPSATDGEAFLRDGSWVPSGVPVSDLEREVTECGVASFAGSLTAPGASASRESGDGVTTWRGLGFLSAFAVLAAVTAIFTLSVINWRDHDARGQREQLRSGPANKAEIKPAEPAAVVANLQAGEVAGNETEPVGGNERPAPAQPQPGAPAMAAPGDRRRISLKDTMRPVKEPPKPGPAPKVAASASAATYDGVPCFRGHKGAATSVVVARDGQLALSAGADHYARLWIIKNGSEISSALHPSEVLDAALLPDSRLAFTCTKGANSPGAVRLWNMTTPKAKVLFTSKRAHAGAIDAVAVFTGGRALSGGRDGQVVLWNLNPNARTPLAILGKQQGPVHSHAVAFFPFGARAATGGKDRFVHIWNLNQGKEVRAWEGHRGAITSIAISANGRRLVSGSSDGSVILWDVNSGSVMRSFSMPEGDRGASVAILPDGNVLAAGRAFGHLLVWDAKTGAVLRQAAGPFVNHNDLAVLPDGQRVLTADQDGVVRLWTPRPQ
jgi:serine/threonine protein kinase